jgi:signal transduction histidine kinase
MSCSHSIPKDVWCTFLWRLGTYSTNCFNVLGNAVKFTSHGSICVSIVVPKLNGVEISIQDTGCGISEDEIGCIFDDFRQASYQIRSKYGGSGLGLSICKKLINSMGGSIDVQSVVVREPIL